MKHYHGTPTGGKADKSAEFMVNRFVLIPWKRPDDLQRAMECSRGFIVDNSAFSFWSTGDKPNWGDYSKWVMDICSHPRFDFALIPDVIDGTPEENNNLIDFWLRTMKAVPSCPVWHLHESIDRLRWLAANFERVAFGSSGEYAKPGQTDGWWNRMNEAFNAITLKSGYPICKVHGLRMLRADIVSKYPFSSCDSTNAVQNGTRNGAAIGLDGYWGSVITANRIESTQSPSVWEFIEQKQLFQLGTQ